MRNLNLWQVSVKNIDIQTEEKFSSCYGHYDDCAKGELYVCTSNLSVFNFDDNGVVKWTADLSEIVPIQTRPVNISFLSLSNSLNVGLASGELITVADFGKNCDVVGVCEDGLLAMEWSPDQEILILVTKTLKVIVMSCTFDPISETYLLSDEFGEKEFINVGWGKKETQFHGSEGKQAAKAKTSDIEDAPVTDERVKISWRGDGNLFGVGYNANGRRKFKVFDRDGNLQSTSENVLGLESNLSWRPSGSLIAATQKLQEKYTVSFFEKNGLKHREFTLPVNSTTTVKELLWTTDSEILIVQCRDEAANLDIVFLYTRRNYYWYLKQTLCFKSTQKINEIICESDFDTANEKRIHVLCQNGECYSYAWNWDVDHSVGKSYDDDAVVAEIDEKKVLVTGFRQTVVPPPMSNIELEFANNINSIHFISDNTTDSNSFIVSHGNKLAIVEQKQKKPLEYVVTKELDIDEYQYPFQHYNWYWLNNDTLLSMSVDGQNVYTLNQYVINSDKLLLKRGTKLPSPIAKIRKHPTDLYSAVLQYTSGEIAVYKYDDKGASLESYHDTLPAACPDFDVVSIDGETTIIGLSHKGCLYINKKLVLNNVNSYYVHTQYLLITTLKHLLICVELSKFGISDLEAYERNETSSSVYKRKVERGSKLVIAVPNDTRTIFQMPRGNL
ncbi:elongator complex protein 1-like [Aricia agestis]|uniref:elongator complex protein 1-like n=2 Tax=Aricia agestis TaxID=91739 RepID=UPI001C204501|nr:elongator complex protein 1-like [Aricia agestis]